MERFVSAWFCSLVSELLEAFFPHTIMRKSASRGRTSELFQWQLGTGKEGEVAEKNVTFLEIPAWNLEAKEPYSRRQVRGVICLQPLS